MLSSVYKLKVKQHKALVLWWWVVESAELYIISKDRKNKKKSLVFLSFFLFSLTKKDICGLKCSRSLPQLAQTTTTAMWLRRSKND